VEVTEKRFPVACGSYFMQKIVGLYPVTRFLNKKFSCNFEAQMAKQLEAQPKN